MALTPQMIEQANKATGRNVPLTGTPAVTSRADEIRALAKQTEPEKKDGFLKSVVKEVGGTLLVKPAAKATEAITRTAFPNSMAAKGYEQMADEGKQEVMGIDVNQKAFGEGGGKQIAGETLKTASYLIPYGKLATGAAGVTGSKLAGNVIAAGTGGYAQDVGQDLVDDKSVGEALTPGVTTAISAAIPTAGPLLRGAGRITKKGGEKLVTSVIPKDAIEAKLLQTYRANKPFTERIGDVLRGEESKGIQTMGKTTFDKGFMGTKSQLGIQATQAKDKLWNGLISPALKKSDKQVDLEGFFTKIEDDIITNNPDKTRQNALLEALDAVKEDYAGTNVISMEKLQKLKENWSQFVPDKAYKGKPIAGSLAEVRNLMSKEARDTIYNELGDDVKKAYFDYGNLIGLQEYGQSAMTGAKLKGGAGSFVYDLFNTTVTPIATIGGQGIYKIGQGIEFVGDLDAKTLGQALGLKFPGDAMVDDIGKRIDDFKKMPNKQGGFIKNPLSNRKKSPIILEAEMDYTDKWDNNIIKKVKVPKYLYHSTNAKNLDSIKKLGLIRKDEFKNWEGTASDVLFFSKYDDFDFANISNQGEKTKSIQFRIKTDNLKKNQIDFDTDMGGDMEDIIDSGNFQISRNFKPSELEFFDDIKKKWVPLLRNK